MDENNYRAIVIAASVAVTAYAFYQILRKEEKGESAKESIQRQIRGFALLLLAQVLLTAGLGLFSNGLTQDLVKNVIRSVRM